MFACSEVEVFPSAIYSAKGTKKTLLINMIICDSLISKIQIDSIRTNRLFKLSKNAFNTVTNKKRYDFYSINIYSDFDMHECVEAYNFTYDSLKNDLVFYSNDLIPKFK
jgi:hypothetical protein